MMFGLLKYNGIVHLSEFAGYSTPIILGVGSFECDYLPWVGHQMRVSLTPLFSYLLPFLKNLSLLFSLSHLIYFCLKTVRRKGITAIISCFGG